MVYKYWLNSIAMMDSSISYNDDEHIESVSWFWPYSFNQSCANKLVYFQIASFRIRIPTNITQRRPHYKGRSCATTEVTDSTSRWWERRYTRTISVGRRSCWRDGATVWWFASTIGYRPRGSTLQRNRVTITNPWVEERQGIYIHLHP